MSKHREDTLEQAIEKYVDSLDMDGLIDYVTSDLWSVYSKADDGDIDEFIEQMGLSDVEMEL